MQLYVWACVWRALDNRDSIILYQCYKVWNIKSGKGGDEKVGTQKMHEDGREHWKDQSLFFFSSMKSLTTLETDMSNPNKSALQPVPEWERQRWKVLKDKRDKLRLTSHVLSISEQDIKKRRGLASLKIMPRPRLFLEAGEENELPLTTLFRQAEI